MREMQRYASLFVASCVVVLLLFFVYKMSVERFTAGVLIPVVTLTPSQEKK